ncbi:thioester reductase domain-containing protein [Paenibacillus motobuensis]|uniref:Carrier domain-containing protein n=1 Tax=Paenibacillus motobuensis TaxID=295324 RepID=A0ABP3I2Y7_9BACL
MRRSKQSIYILASFTANMLETYLTEELGKSCPDIAVTTGPYNQIVPQCINGDSLLYQARPDYIVVWPRLEEILGSRNFYRKQSFDECRHDLSLLVEAVLRAKEHLGSKLIFVLPAVYENRPLGAGDLQAERGAMETSMQLRLLLLDKLRRAEDVLLADAEELVRSFGAASSYSMAMYAFAKVPYVNQIYREAASVIGRLIRLSTQPARNILTFDAEFLLCGREEQINTGMLRELNEASLADDDSLRLFQAYLSELAEWGHEMLLCSGSDQAAVERIFASAGPGISLDRFSYTCFNCASIAEAVARIHESHGVVQEAFLVLDTGEGAQDGLRRLLLPDDPALWMESVAASGALDLLPAESGFFEREDIHADDAEADKAYKLEDFLRSIRLELSLTKMAPAQTEAVEHLLHATKDFNLTGQIWTSDQLLSMLSQEDKAVYTVRVQDRFGDYGIAGVVIGTVGFHDFTFTVDNLLLNCRVLGKNAEFHLVQQLISNIREYGCDCLTLQYRPNGRNELAARFLADIAKIAPERVRAGEKITIPAELLEEYADISLQSGQGGDPEAAERKPAAEAARHGQTEASFDPYRFMADTWKGMKPSEREEIVRFIDDTRSVEEIMRAIGDSKARTRAGIQAEYKEPRTETERLIAGLWAEVLSIDRVGVLDNFFGLGGTSVMAAQLIVKYKQAFGVKLPVRIFFDSSSVEQMAMYIDALRIEEDKRELDESAVSNFRYRTREFLKGEVWLDDAVSAQGKGKPPETAPVRTVLLTGATGFLGAFLLEELMAMTDYRVVLLVRAENPQSGYERVVDNMKRYCLWKAEYGGRIVVRVGDLAKPLLGLGPRNFQELADEIHMIYHAGAITNFLEPYPMIKDVNVQGAQEILRLAAAGAVKPVHYISTHYVFSNLAHEHGFVAYEDTVPSSDEVLVLGYQQSKWVAENMMALAKERGIPVSIYRVGRISGSSVTGACQTKDIMWLMIKCCVEAGVLFDEDVKIEFIPVDYVSRSIIALSVQPESRNRNFHIAGKTMNRLHQVYEWMKRYGFQVDTMPYERWKDELVERAARNPELNTVKAMLPFIPEDMAEWDVEIVYDETNVKRGLRHTGIACPEVDEAMFARYLDYFIETGFFTVDPQRQSV